jgi:site-specific DNA-methyltransferase (adenine-specific)
MLDSIPEWVWRNKEAKFIDNSCGNGNFLIEMKTRLMRYHDENYILKNMLYGVDIQPDNVYEASKRLGGGNIKVSDAINFDYWNGLKFDVVVGNPPYQENDLNGRSKGGRNLYTKFIVKCEEICKEGGFLCLLTPTGWMTPASKIWDSIFRKNYVSIINLNYKKLKSYFKEVNVVFSWFTIKKSGECGTTRIICEDSVYETDLKKHNFIPRNTSKNTFSIMDKVFQSELPNLSFIRNCTLHSVHKDKLFRSSNEDGKHIYPVQHTSSYMKRGKVMYSWKPHPYQNHKKVIISRSGYFNPWYDDGKYGVTEQSIIILVSNAAEAISIVSSLNSKLYRFILECFREAKSINVNIIKLLKKIPTHIVSDSDIYRLFNINEDEIKTIQNYIKK